VDLYFRRTQGKASNPKPSEIDLDLRKFIETCWHRQLRQSGKPVCQRSGDMTWLTTMPLASYHVDDAPDGGSVLYRFLIQTPACGAAGRPGGLRSCGFGSPLEVYPGGYELSVSKKNRPL
jgi:hypothetical protein